MKWATRRGVHIDRAGSGWLIMRFVDPDAEFVFVDDPDDVPPGATPFDMRGARLSHRRDDCTFETVLRDYGLDDPVLWDIARIVHQADLEDDQYDAPEAPGLELVIRGLSLSLSDADTLAQSAPIFDGLYAARRQALLGGTG